MRGGSSSQQQRTSVSAPIDIHSLRSVSFWLGELRRMVCINKRREAAAEAS